MSLMGTWSDAQGRSKATDCGVTPSGPAVGLGVPAWPQLGNHRGPGIPSLRLGSFCSIFRYSSDSPHPRGMGGGLGPTTAGQGRGHAEGSPGKFIKHLKRIMTRCMDQVMERNYTLKCGDEKKDKGTRRIVIRPCQW
ncbi:dexamethasone-induced protein isoform X2 [Melopsittacus undulatus]|uniref:dexamethasone-induced protein isoform X2 n=1 Tax=Melopsittacus undulatus TaxID=13146 RepID=UPI00146A8C4E|nr:dexamethasone-induced protein isoform X2 [Melopsittacus undulatus]